MVKEHQLLTIYSAEIIPSAENSHKLLHIISVAWQMSILTVKLCRCLSLKLVVDIEIILANLELGDFYLKICE